MANQYIILLTKLSLIITWMALTNQGITDRLLSIDTLAGKAAYITVWIFCFASIFLVAFFSGWNTRIFFGILLFFSGIANNLTTTIIGNDLDFYSFSKFIIEIGNADKVYQFYKESVHKSILLNAIGILGIILPPIKKRIKLTTASIAFLAPVLCITAIIYIRGGYGTKGLPGQFKLTSISLIYFGEKILYKDPVRKTPSQPKYPHKINNIIYIVDESIGGDYLDINNPHDGVESGLSDLDYAYNFGIVSSISNCSAATNFGLRYSITRDKPLSTLYLNPSIWKFAKTAGYKTAYIDAQRYEKKLQNYMTAEEAKDIDIYINIKRTDRLYEKDIQAAKKIISLLSNKNRLFILLNKTGAHFPYEGKYPANKKRFTPTMSWEYKSDDSAPDLRKLKEKYSDKANPNMKKNINAEKVINSYKNAVYHSTNSFFTYLLSHANSSILENSLIIYTSDHGQSFKRANSGVFSPHCNPPEFATSDEGRVPLVLITKNKSVGREIKKSVEANIDKLTQFSIAPSIYYLMGYNRLYLQNNLHLETDIFETVHNSTSRKYMSQMMVKFGQTPIWTSIDKE